MKGRRAILWSVVGLTVLALWIWGGVLVFAKYKRESRLVREYQVLAYRYALPAEGYKNCLRILGSNPQSGGPHFVPVYRDYEVILFWDASAAGGDGEWKLAPEVLRLTPPEIKPGAPIDEPTALALGQYHASTVLHRFPEKVAVLLGRAPQVTRDAKEGVWRVTYASEGSATPGLVVRLKPTGGLLDLQALLSE